MSKAARVAYPHIRRMVREGLSANEIQRTLQAAGLGIRRQDLLAIVRDLRLAPVTISDLRRLPRDVAIPIERIRPAMTKISGAVSYTVQLTVRDPETFESRTILRTAHSDAPVGLGVVEDAIASGQTFEYLARDLIVEGVEVIDVVRAGREGVL